MIKNNVSSGISEQHRKTS